MKNKQRVLGSVENNVVAPELVIERDRLDFDQKELHDVWFPPCAARTIMEKTLADMASDPMLQKSFKYFEMTPEQVQYNYMKKLNHLWFKKDREFYWKHAKETEQFYFWSYEGQPPIGMHLSMFTPSIQSFADEEQYAKWVPKALNMDIIGCYAQTEIGHGSDVSGLQTTGTFDMETDEFVMNTPTPTATKWWPGDMGRFANFALVFARLIVEVDGDKNDYGVVPFLVQIRDLDTHKHMPGVKCGDMGPKYGFNSKDNGWLTLENVRIPRSQLLQKLLQVDRDGSVSMEGDPKALYVTMMAIRFSIFSCTRLILLHGLTITLRYSIVRRQFKNNSDSKEEMQLLDYQTQQMKLFPLVAIMFAQSFITQHTRVKYDELVEGMQKDDYSLMDLLHHFTSGLKSTHSQEVFDALLIMRQSIGGAGYIAWSGLPHLINETSPLPTFEGDNTVMAQQSFNYLLKLGKEISEGTQRSENDQAFSYLYQMGELQAKKCACLQPIDFLNLNTIGEALEVNLATKFSNLLSLYLGSKASKKDFINSLYAQDVFEISTEHIRYVSFFYFRQRATNSGIKCENVKKHLSKLCMLYGLFNLYKDSKGCYDCGYFASGVSYSDLILEAMKQLNREIRPHILNIIEAIPRSDNYLCSAIGNYNGDIYEQHLKLAQGSQMNQTKAGDAIPDGYLELVKPILQAKM